MSSWPSQSTELYAVKTLLFTGEHALSNFDRLNRWKHKWMCITGDRPLNLYTVAFCRVCNKPHWFNAKHRYLNARCEGH